MRGKMLTLREPLTAPAGIMLRRGSGVKTCDFSAL